MGILGFTQGFSVLIVRFVLAALCLLLFKYAALDIENFLARFIPSWADTAALVAIVIFAIIIQQIGSMIYRKIRDALLLKWPDRFVGLAIGLIGSFFLIAIVTVNVRPLSGKLDAAINQSRSSKILKYLEPYAAKVFQPDSFDRGKQKIKRFFK